LISFSQEHQPHLATAAHASAEPSFDERVNTAVGIVTQQFPRAQLYEAEGAASKGPTTDPEQIDEMRVVFRDGDHHTIFIKETSVGEFGPPVVAPVSWDGDLLIDWPVKMDLERANQLKDAAGYTAPYDSAILRAPFGSSDTGNPAFEFSSQPSNQHVFVDTVTGAVTVATTPGAGHLGF